MELNHTFQYRFNIVPELLHNDIEYHIKQKCNDELLNKIYKGKIVTKINHVKVNKNYKINYNGIIETVSYVNCIIIDPENDSELEIKINDVNKMGFSYKSNKLCIFIPIHFCTKTIRIGDSIKVKIVGKRIEEDMVCIGKPIN